ncbi:MAG TPA: glucosyl-3-phosphoglycerate synthase [Acidimicrobiales bacterium]
MPVPALRTYHHSSFGAADLAAAKDGRVVSVCIPARNEGPTVGGIVASIRKHLVELAPVVDEILVIDDGSTDDTADRSAEAGARVVPAGEVLSDHTSGPGKGQAMWKSVYAARGDLIVWCDADIANFGPRFIVGLLGPLLAHDDVDMVKAFYDRPSRDGTVGEGGRVTELVARPLISRFFPRLSAVVQPLAGEYGGRRQVLEQLPFSPGYGVDLALLIDLVDRVGLDGLVQVDLGVREHRNRPLSDLGPQAMAIIEMVLGRAGIDQPGAATLIRPDQPPVTVEVDDLPPLADLDLDLAARESA